MKPPGRVCHYGGAGLCLVSTRATYGASTLMGPPPWPHCPGIDSELRFPALAAAAALT
jgi:hypothetical protein